MIQRGYALHVVQLDAPPAPHPRHVESTWWLSSCPALASVLASIDAAFVSREPWQRAQSLAGGIGMIAIALLLSPVGRGRVRFPLAIVGASFCFLAASARFWR